MRYRKAKIDTLERFELKSLLEIPGRSSPSSSRRKKLKRIILIPHHQCLFIIIK